MNLQIIEVPPLGLRRAGWSMLRRAAERGPARAVGLPECGAHRSALVFRRSRPRRSPSRRRAGAVFRVRRSSRCLSRCKSSREWIWPAVVEHREPAAADPAAGQALQLSAAFPHRAGARRVGLRPGVAGDALLAGQVGLPGDPSFMVAGDEYLPLVAGHLTASAGQHPAGVKVALGSGAAVGAGAGIGRVRQGGMHRVAGRRYPGDLGVLAAPAGALQGPAQALIAQPQPHPADRPAYRELLEHRTDHAGDSLIGVEGRELACIGLPTSHIRITPSDALVAGGTVQAAPPAMTSAALSTPTTPLARLAHEGPSWPGSSSYSRTVKWCLQIHRPYAPPFGGLSPVPAFSTCPDHPVQLSVSMGQGPHIRLVSLATFRNLCLILPVILIVQLWPMIA